MDCCAHYMSCSLVIVSLAVIFRSNYTTTVNSGHTHYQVETPIYCGLY